MPICMSALLRHCDTGLQGLLSWALLWSVFWLGLAKSKHQKKEKEFRAFLHYPLPYLLTARQGPDSSLLLETEQSVVVTL